MPTDHDAAGVQVIRRAARILEALKDRPEGQSLSQLSDSTGLPRSTVHRLVTALEAERLVVAASRNARYRLGPMIATLAAAAERNLVLDYHPHLTSLARAVNETVDLAILEYDHVRFLDQIPASHRLRAVSAVGAVFPAYCTANGKALLARLPHDQLVRLLPERLEAMTPNTITDRARLFDQLAEVRAAGVAFDREEHTVGICAVGVALEDAEGQVVAVSVPLPAPRFLESEATIVQALLDLRGELNGVSPNGVVARDAGGARSRR